jgi:hypothetical protein
MQIPSQRTRTLLIVAVFSLAGYVSAQVYTSYSSWLDVQVKALHEKYAPGMYGNAGKRSEAFNLFYREHAAMDVYAIRKWTIFCLGFPIALTVAFFLARFAGWLGHIDLGPGVAGLGLVYILPAPALFLSGVTRFLLTIPCLVGVAVGLAVSLKIITTRWSTKLCLGFLLSCAFCCLWGWSVARDSVDMGWNVFFFSLETMWAGIFGLGLVLPPRARPLQMTNTSLTSVQPQSHSLRCS